MNCSLLYMAGDLLWRRGKENNPHTTWKGANEKSLKSQPPAALGKPTIGTNGKKGVFPF